MQHAFKVSWNLCQIHMRFQITAAALILAATSAQASPWAEVGDSQLRADIVLLGEAGVIEDFSGQWPLPWAGLLQGLSDRTASGLPIGLRAAAQRVSAKARAGTDDGFSAAVMLGAASTPSLVYGFGGLGRGDGMTQISLAWNGESTAARLSLGAFTMDFTGRSLKFMPDESFIAQKIGDDVVVYGGWLSHWWGPGWISALALSNNARPMPQIGIQRAGAASGWPVLEWLGPWQVEFFVGLLDDPRIERNTLYNAFRIVFQPLDGLEIGLARTEQLCGENHPCVPLRDTLHFANDPTNVNFTNAQGQIDVKWTHRFYGVPTQLYMSLMNEDTSPITNSGTVHLFGATIFLPMGSGSPLRLTAEFTDSVPTRNLFSFGDVFHGFAYTNYSYVDGMRYRGRTLGFSLDSDSRLLSLQAGWSDPAGRFYELSFHNAHVSNPANLSGNVVTAAPVRVNMGEARVSLPWNGMRLDFAMRLQDDQPRPRSGFEASFETVLRAPL
jgi:hypothetical protein